MNNNTPGQEGEQPLPAGAKLMAFYLSRDRVLSLIDTERLPPLHLQALQGADVVDVDGLQVAEQHHQDGEADRRFGGCHRQDEEHEHLAVQVAAELREGDEVGVHRQQHQFDRHQQHDDVLAVEKDAEDPEREGEAASVSRGEE